VTHPTVIRAALAHALGIPLPAALAIDVAPLSRTRLSFNRSWRLHSLTPAD
jgi:broad specificity phosphatase PhoE